MTQLTETLYAIVLPADAYDFKINRIGCISYRLNGNLQRTKEEKFIESTIIGTVTEEGIDFDVEPYVEFSDLGYKYYK